LIVFQAHEYYANDGKRTYQERNRFLSSRQLAEIDLHRDNIITMATVSMMLTLLRSAVDADVNDDGVCFEANDILMIVDDDDDAYADIIVVNIELI